MMLPLEKSNEWFEKFDRCVKNCIQEDLKAGKVTTRGELVENDTARVIKRFKTAYQEDILAWSINYRINLSTAIQRRDHLLSVGSEAYFAYYGDDDTVALVHDRADIQALKLTLPTGVTLNVYNYSAVTRADETEQEFRDAWDALFTTGLPVTRYTALTPCPHVVHATERTPRIVHITRASGEKQLGVYLAYDDVSMMFMNEVDI
jgi:hypothetical protein